MIVASSHREQTRARYPDEEGYVERDGVRVFYEVYGSGEPTVFLLPTWSLIHSRHWKMQIPYLARHCRVVTFDGRGNGGSDRPVGAETYAIREFALDALAVLDGTATERDIGPVLDRVIGEAAGRVFVVCTSSHVHRIQQVLSAARNRQRHVAIIGRSMVRNAGIADDLGYLNVPPGLVLSVDEVNKLPDDGMLVLCTGSQGEPAAALSRMARGQHKDFTLGEGDLVIFASGWPTPGSMSSPVNRRRSTSAATPRPAS